MLFIISGAVGKQLKDGLADLETRGGKALQQAERARGSVNRNEKVC